MNTISKQQAVLAFLESMTNTYWAIAEDLPKLMKARIPGFTIDNAEAEPIIKSWEAFKNNPNEETFGKFIDLLKMYGSK